MNIQELTREQLIAQIKELSVKIDEHAKEQAKSICTNRRTISLLVSRSANRDLHYGFARGYSCCQQSDTGVFGIL